MQDNNQDLDVNNRKSYLRALKDVLSTFEGREVLLSILNETDAYRPIYDENTHAFYYRHGRQSVGLLLMNDIISLGDGEFTSMLNDYKQRVAIEKERLKNG